MMGYAYCSHTELFFVLFLLNNLFDIQGSLPKLPDSLTEVYTVCNDKI